MSEKEFIKLAKKLDYSEKDRELFEQAISFSKPLLLHKRLDGSTQFDHALRLSTTLLENKFPKEVIVAGLLYGVEEHIFPSDLKEFGKDITDIVFGKQQLIEVRKKNKDLEAESLRKILLITLKDTRIILVKLASKLDNMHHLDYLPIKRQRELAQGVFDIYSPLATRLGVEKIRLDLDDIAFKVKNPKKYQEIKKFLKESEEQRQENIKYAINHTKKLLKEIDCTIKGRPKHIYSIYKKLNKTKLDKQLDHLALRIVASSVHDCYTVLGILHQDLKPKAGTLKDYIANPKSNNYRSIHTVLTFPNDKIVEVQIRTKEMDEFAEEGGAAHWSYKNMKSEAKFEKQTGWLKNVLDTQKDNSEFLNTVKVDVFGDRFYAFTPKGKAIDLPNGATILDFAYHIHQAVGDQSIGGRINGRFSPLKTKLKSGDVVEIVTNKHQRPRRDWLKIVVSSRAKAKVRQGINKYENIPAQTTYQLVKKEKDEFDSFTHCEDFPNFQTSLAKCCNPLPTEKIIGVLKSNREISVHKKDCRRANKERNISVKWKETLSRPIKIEVISLERSGVLADLLNTLVRLGFTVKSAKAKMLGKESVSSEFIVNPRELTEVEKAIKRLEKVNGTTRVSLL